MPYVSARYMPAGPLDTPEMARPVQAIDDYGQVWALREDSEVGDWLRFIEGGGTVEPEGTVWEGDAPPAPPPPTGGEAAGGIGPAPTAEPNVLQDAPVEE